MFLRILECQKIECMTNKNANEFIDTTTTKNHIESDENPWQIDCLKASTEPERDNCITIELAPDIKNTQDHRFK